MGNAQESRQRSVYNPPRTSGHLEPSSINLGGLAVVHHLRHLLRRTGYIAIKSLQFKSQLCFAFAAAASFQIPNNDC